MYHLELRHFPKRLQRYNLSGAEIGAVVLPWVQEKVIELGEQKWVPHQATIAIFEGPEVAPQEISLARGWSTVQRESRDVTEQVLAEARAHLQERAPGGGGEAAGVPAHSPFASATAPGLHDSSGAQATPAGQAGAALRGQAGAALGDPLTLALQLGALLGPDGARLLEAWRTVRVREPALTPSEALALAERELAGGDAAGH